MSKKLLPFDLNKFKNGQKAITENGKLVKFSSELYFEEHKFQKEHIRLLVSVDGCKYSRVYFESGRDSNYEKPDSIIGMVSHHQNLIDSYKDGDAWQFKSALTKGKWLNSLHRGGWCEPEWAENTEYRLHPHNELIRSYDSTQRYQYRTLNSAEDWEDCRSKPLWDITREYRIKPKELTYPIYKKSKDSKRIVHFDSEQSGTVVHSKDPNEVSYTCQYWVNHWKEDCEYKETRTVYEWMFKDNNGNWVIGTGLATEEDAERASKVMNKELVKTGRLFEVPI